VQPDELLVQPDNGELGAHKSGEEKKFDSVFFFFFWGGGGGGAAMAHQGSKSKQKSKSG
jgi:hypothetical protein